MWLFLLVIGLALVIVLMLWQRPGLPQSGPYLIQVKDELDLDVCTSRDAQFETQTYQVVTDPSDEIVL